MGEVKVLFKLHGRDVVLEEVTEFLGSIPLLQQLPGMHIVKIAEAVKVKHFGPGEVIVQKGDRGEGFYFIWKGQAEVIPTTDTVGNVLQPGDYFGIVSIDSKEVHRAAVVVPKEVTCLVLPHQHAGLLSSDSIWAHIEPEGVATVERILQLKKLEVDIFQGDTLPQTRIGYVFGGQFVGQALAAASKSVDPSLLVHSLHSYFISVGDESLPVVYQVHRVRDGSRFATRRVVAIQKGKSIFTLTASFQREEKSIEHQEPMPDAPDPEQLLSQEQLEKIMLGDPRIPLPVREAIAAFPLKQHPLDIRSCDPVDLSNPVDSEPRQRVWLRSKERLSDDQAMHRCVAAYASDWIFLQTVLRPYKSSGKQYRLLSLDHSLWFHKPLKADDWLLYTIRSPRASGSRGLVIGHMYNRTGELVVTAVQEGLARPRNATGTTNSKL